MFAFLIFLFTVSALSNAENMASSPSDQEDNYCLLPAYPEHGSYIVRNHHSATPGQRYSSVKLDISCDTGYLNNSTIKSIFCINGEWSASMSTSCVRDLLGFCTVPTGDLRVEYRCLSFPGTLERSWECENLVSRRTIVRPLCRFPGYFSRKVLSDMHCRNGTWDYKPICKSACGLTTQHRQLEGTSNNHLELPWHVAIYKKSSESYYHMCGGSLITATKIISAAGCFYDIYKNELRPASDFKMAVNKMYIDYNDTRDRNTQYSDVDDIIIPSSYRDRATRNEDDIAIVVVKRPIFFHLSVLPVCLDFDNDLDSTQLVDGNSGKTVEWSRVINNRDSDVLNVIDLSYMKNEDCNTILPTNGQPLLPKDKFCTRINNENAFTYYGGGLAFLESTTQRYYLRGVRSDYFRTVDGVVIHTFISIIKHANFIKQHL